MSREREKVNPLARTNIMPPVMVEWEDSAQAAPQWQWLEGAEVPATPVCRSVGFIVRSDDDLIALAISIAGTGSSAQVSGVISIPKRAVRHIYRLSGNVWAIA